MTKTRALVIILLLICSNAYSAQVDYKIIIWLESRGNPLAKSNYNALGLMQITPIVLKEYNSFHNTEYTIKKLYEPIFNVKVGRWYLEKRIPQMLHYYKKPVNIRNILICYNAGISYVVSGKKIPSQTKAYIRNYNKKIFNPKGNQ